MIEEIRRKADEPYSLGYRELAKIIYRDHPAGREATVATVTGIARSDVSAFHSKYVRPDNAVIGISGDMTKAEALEKIGRYLGSWKRGAEVPVISRDEVRERPVGQLHIQGPQPGLHLRRPHGYEQRQSRRARGRNNGPHPGQRELHVLDNQAGEKRRGPRLRRRLVLR